MPHDLESDEFLLIVGANLKAERLRAGYKQEQAAEHIGVELSTYQRYEYGKTRISMNKLRRLAELFGCDLNTLSRLPEEGK
jgi:transcriptional regulator with XRE-family HTH domain